jgi:tryptophan-rich sensory protein
MLDATQQLGLTLSIGVQVPMRSFSFTGACFGKTRTVSSGAECRTQQNEKKANESVNHHRLSLVLFLLVTGGGLLVGWSTAPGEWYAQLSKPAFNPPSWIFAPVWTVLYLLIAIAGWRAWQREPRTLPMTLWWVQLALNFLWSPTFFAAHRIGLALVIVLLLLAVILAFAATSWRLDRVTALLFAPYAVWVAFAAMLNASIFMLN